MSEYRFTKLASEDLEQIFDHLSAHNPVAAAKQLDSIEARCSTLSQMPHSGRNRDELFSGLQSVAEGNYIIFFQAEPYGILVIRILHSKRDLDNHF